MEIKLTIKVNGIEMPVEINIEASAIEEGIEKAVNIINEEYLIDTDIRLSTQDIEKYNITLN